MITRNDVVDAITRCVGYDPVHAPRQSEIMADAWTQHFMLSANAGLMRTELLVAVDDYYRTPRQPWPQPADISAIARGARQDIGSREEDPPGAGIPGVRRDRFGFIDRSEPEEEDPPGWETWGAEQRVKYYWAELEKKRAVGRRYD